MFLFIYFLLVRHSLNNCTHCKHVCDSLLIVGSRFLCKGLCLCKHGLSQVFSVTGLDDCRHVFKQEIQETAPHVYSQPVLSTGKDTL